MATPTWWTWVWASSGSWWWTGKPGVLQSMGSQRVWESSLFSTPSPAFIAYRLLDIMKWYLIVVLICISLMIMSSLATSCKELTHWKRLWFWEGLGAGDEGDDRGWDGWMASLTRWTWVWVNSGSWWWTGRPGMLRFMGSQWVGHDWATEMNWTELNWTDFYP